MRNSQNNNPVTGAVVSVTNEDGVVAKNVTVNAEGIAVIPVKKNGLYKVHVEAEDFVTGDIEMKVKCTSADCPNKKLLTLSPTLEPEETRIMMNWETNTPSDVDLHIIAVKNSDQSTCRTYFSKKNSCEKISLDLDNTRGGQNGAETITLQDNSINKDYVYLIGIEDYGWEADGTPFLSAGATITITNGVKTDIMKMEASSIDKSAEYDIYMCNY